MIKLFSMPARWQYKLIPSCLQNLSPVVTDNRIRSYKIRKKRGFVKKNLLTD